MSKQVVITRKIQISFDAPKDQLKDLYVKIFGWQRIVHKAANWIISHQYLQENVKDFIYLTDEVKKKLANIEKDEDGILTTSKDNTTYQLLSKAFKGDCPMGMLSGLNTVICKKYKSDAFKIKQGQVSLPSFRGNIPMPVRAADISSMVPTEDNENYTFFVYGTPFKTYFGKDMSGNKELFDRVISGEYKLCDSSIKLEKVGGKYKMFFLAVLSFDKQVIKVDKNKVASCRLSVEYPITIAEKKKFWNIGTAEEFLHRRMAIKGALSRLQAACKYNKGGKGRAKKMAAIERFEKAEVDYVISRMHLYSRMLVDYCIKRGIGTIVLENYQDAVEETHEGTEKSKFLLQSWSYFNLSEKIAYKANKVGIEVELHGKEKKEKVEIPTE